MGILSKIFGNNEATCVAPDISWETRHAQNKKNQETLEEIEVELGLYGLYGDQVPKDQMRLCSLIRRVKENLYS